MSSIYSVVDVQENLQAIIQNQPPANDIPPPPIDQSTRPLPPLTRRFSVTQNFQEGHYLWDDGYDGYLAVGAGDVIEEVLNGNSTESHIDAQINGRRGYIPKNILTDK